MPTNKDEPNDKNDYDKLLKKVRRNPYQIPDSVIAQLSEHTSGFILCALDGDGNLVFNENFDNDAVASAVQFKMLQILTIRHQQESLDLKNQILGTDSDPEE